LLTTLISDYRTSNSGIDDLNLSLLNSDLY
jgi:hypothetical protein